MNHSRHLAAFLMVSLAFLVSVPARAWEVIPGELSGFEGQSVNFDIVVEADEWAPAGTVCNEVIWDFEFQLDGIPTDGTAEWGVDLSNPFASGALSGICSNEEEEVTTAYSIALIEDFTPEDTEQAEIFFEHCEAARGVEVCDDQTLVVEVIEVAGGGLPVVGILPVTHAAEPVTDGRFWVFLEAPAPDGGLMVDLHFGGTALPGTDYVALTNSVFIPEGAIEVFVDIDVINDGLIEGTETIQITILEDPSYTVSFQLERATVLILDDDGDGPVININQGISDAWFNPATPGQGFFIIVFPEIRKIFLAWFTYDTQRPPPNAMSVLGDAGHRWLTALGDYGGNSAVLAIEITRGGVFNAVPPNTTQTLDGTITLEFLDCNTGLLHYNIPSLGLSGTVPIQRTTPDNVGLCESQNAGP